jgi:hypothetical protein
MLYKVLRTAVLGATLLGISAQAADASDTIAGILAAPKTYDGKQVTLTGKVVDALMKSGSGIGHPRPPYYILNFCDDTGCMTVVTGNAVTADPVARWKAHGTFWIDRGDTPNSISEASLSSVAPVGAVASPSPAGT